MPLRTLLKAVPIAIAPLSWLLTPQHVMAITADQQPTTIYKCWRSDCAVAYFIGSEAEVIARLNAL
jgi:hypothetical protein